MKWSLAALLSLLMGYPTGSAHGAERVQDGVFEWVEAFEAHVLTPKEREAMEERLEVAAMERASRGSIGGIDNADDVYQDPERGLVEDPLQLHRLNPDEFDIPIVVNAQVEEAMRRLLGPGRKYMARWLERRERYKDLIHAEMDAAGLPRDLLYVSMVESGFSPYAFSRASASGLWQFMAPTGRQYELQVDWWMDERRDPKKSTKAAATYLASLHSSFDGDWYLAMAAYNTGPGRLRRALQRSGEGSDYWDLHRKDLIHAETKGYVPKIIAAAIIGKHPEWYGFDNLEPHEALAFDEVVIEGGADVDLLAQCAELDEEAFRDLNPSYKRFALPDGTHHLRVPVGTSDSFLAALTAIPPQQRRRIIQHRVSSGESLSVIARKYGLPVEAVVRANRLPNANRIRVGQMLIIPVGGGAPRLTESKAGESRGPATISGGSYTVKRGDTLSEIAENAGVSLSDLKRWNNIRDVSALQVGEVLVLRSPSRPAPSSSDARPAASDARPTASGASSKTPSTYKVRSGDSWWAIAEKHQMTVAELTALNGASANSTLQPGQVLRLAGKAPASDSSAWGGVHKVVSGETLSEIAAQYGVSLSALQRENQITDPSKVQVGQRLKVPASAASSSATSSSAPAKTYTVKGGDTLSEIAEDHGVSLASLRSANGLSNSSTLRVGQRLTIPGGGSTTWSTHVVKSGESLGLIAQRRGCSVEDLIRWNDLNGTTIQPGQKLRFKSR